MSKTKLNHLYTEFLEAKVSDCDMFEVSAVAENADYFEVANMIKLAGSGSILVLDANDRMQGIITERDLLKHFHATDRDKLIAKNLMTVSPQAHKKNTSLARILYDCAEKGHRHIPIVFAQTYPEFILTSQNIIAYLYQHFVSNLANLAKSRLDHDSGTLSKLLNGSVMQLKPAKALTANINTKIVEAIQLMHTKKIGCLLLIDQQGTLEGIFSESDFVNRYLPEIDSKAKNVSLLSYYTPEPKSVLKTDSIMTALSVMAQGGFRHLPIVDSSNKLQGILSVKNFMVALSQAILNDIQQDKDTKS